MAEGDSMRGTTLLNGSQIGSPGVRSNIARDVMDRHIIGLAVSDVQVKIPQSKEEVARLLSMAHPSEETVKMFVDAGAISARAYYEEACERGNAHLGPIDLQGSYD